MTAAAAARRTLPERPQPVAPLPLGRRIWHDHGLSIALLALFLISFDAPIWDTGT